MRGLAFRQADGRCCALLAIGLALWPTAPVRAQESATPSPYEQVLILQKGQVLKGKISRSPNGYRVEQPTGGNLMLPFDEVRATGNTLQDAFKHLRESFLEPTAETHYQLGLWCFEHKLLNEAREELAMSLERNPDHQGARDLLKRMDEMTAQTRRPPPARSQSEIRMAWGKEIPEVESLGGFSKETAKMFTLGVQPILNNKCGRAGCHGAQSEQTFRLEPIRGTGARHPLFAERNLAAVMAQIDLEHPDQSPLLSACDGQHGGDLRPVFGPQNSKQRQILMNWVRMAAREKQIQQEKAEQRASVIAKRKAGRSKGKLATAAQVAERTKEPEDVPMASVPGDHEVSAEAETDDPFNPDAFNERYHGIVTKKETRTPARKTPAGQKDSP